MTTSWIRWCLAGLGVLLLNACSEAGPSAEGPSRLRTTSPAETRESPPSSDLSLKIIDTDYKPLEVTVEIGTTVSWQQIGDQPHSVTDAGGRFDSSPDCGPIDPDECLGQGDSFSYAFTKSGRYIYYCRVHGLPDGTGMVGTIIVR